MSEQIVAAPNVEPAEVSKDELILATEIMQAIVKTSKGFRMYLSNNPLLARFINELKTKVAKHLSLYGGELTLEIDQFHLKYRGKTIYENLDPKESMAFKMYSDGIRFLIFSEGIEESELCELLEIIGKDRPNELDDDIVTLLWEKNLPNLTYILAEDFLEFDSAGGGSINPQSQQDKIFGIYQSISATTPPSSPMLVPQKILTLTEEETQWLKNAREAEETRRPLDEVIQIVTTILAGEQDPQMFGEFAEIMAKLTESLANSGEIRYTFSLVKFLGNLAKNDQVSPANREKIANTIGMIFSERTMNSLSSTLNSSDLIAPEELLEFLNFFGKSSLDRICAFLGLVEKMKIRRIVIQALIEIGHDSPEPFFAYLSDPKWYMVRNMVFILARIDSAKALEHVSPLISHKEPRVRREVLNYLEKVSDPKAKNHILRFLRDESSPLRIRALQVLAGGRCTFALKSIAAMTTAEQFGEKDIVEKKAVFEAMGELGAEQMLPLFRDLLMKKYWFNKTKEKESVACAVAGLVKIRSEAAVKLLQEARAVKNDEIGEIIIQAMETMTAEDVKGFAGP